MRAVVPPVAAARSGPEHPAGRQDPTGQGFPAAPRGLDPPPLVPVGDRLPVLSTVLPTGLAIGQNGTRKGRC